MQSTPKYQVFISSTFEDLRGERDQVIKAVLEMGHIPVGMEMFSAADEQQWKIIARHIDESDYYAVIVAHRLGSLTDEGISYTRKEYEYARSKGIPCLGFLIDSSANWPADRVDKKASNVDALDAFKSLIRNKPVSTWSNAEDLHGKFSIALMKNFTAQPREGWIRASSATGGPEATQELVRLSAENGELRRRLSAFEATVAEEKSEEIRHTLDILLASKRTPSYKYTRGGEWQDDSEVSLHFVFQVLGPEMLVEASAEHLSGNLALEIRQDKEQGWEMVALNHTRDILADLMTLDLVQPSRRKHSVQDNQEYWSISEFGLEVLKRIRRDALVESRADAAPEEQGDAGVDDSTVVSDRADR